MLRVSFLRHRALLGRLWWAGWEDVRIAVAPGRWQGRPLVRIANLQTHHAFYCRTHDFSSMGVAIHKPVSAQFDVPEGVETGP